MWLPTARRPLIGLLAALCAVLLVAAGCGGRQADTGQENKKITIGYIAWDENIAVSHLHKVLLEKKGYEVDLKQLEAGPLYAGLAQGNIDLFLDAWLPTTHADYWQQYSGKLEDLGVWYDQATLNLAVPDYVHDINSIADLKGKAGQFDGSITGIEPSAGETRIVRDNVLPQYELQGEYQLELSSTTAMLAALHKAINERKPIVVTLWHPHWAYARYPLKDLTDPRGAMGAAEQLHSVGRTNFGADFPEVTEMVKKFRLDDRQLGDLENVINGAEKGQEDAAAQRWVDQNQDLVDTFAR